MSYKNDTHIKNEYYDYPYFYMLKRLFVYVKPYTFRAIVAFLITIPVASFDGIVAFSIKPYIEEVIVNKNIAVLNYVPFIVFGYAVLHSVFSYISVYLSSWLGQKVTIDVKTDLFRKLLNNDIAIMNINTSGYILARYSADADAVSGALLGNTKELISKVLSMAVLLAVLFYNSWQLTLIIIFVGCVIFLPLKTIKRKVRYVAKGWLEAGSKLITTYNENHAGFRTIISYNLIDYQVEKFQKILRKCFDLSMQITKTNGWITPLMHMIFSIAVAFVIWFGSYLVVQKQISIGSLISFMTALILIYKPLKSIGGLIISTCNSFIVMGRVIHISDYKSPIYSKKDAVNLEKSINNIEFDNVCFEYNDNKPILKGINLTVKNATTTAFVGTSGGGKTTLVNLIPRFYDVNEGKIEINGVNIKDINLNSLRTNVAVVFQDNFLFDGTIRENILIGNFDATEDEIDKAIKASCLDEFIYSLEDGLDTPVGERGVLLSGGQKQRIAIARAFLKDAPIVILDEATSSLDNESEAIVQKAMDKLMDNRTVFVIAHRLSTIQNADKIVVLEDGQIVEEGTHDTLMVKDGAYKKLHEAQFKEK